MAISTYKVFLMNSSNGELYTKLVDIKSYPDLGGAPEMLETTTLSDGMQTFIAGIQTLEAVEFEANYTKEDYQKLKALEGSTEKYAVWFGASGEMGNLTPTGDLGKFAFEGQLSVNVTGGGVNEVVGMNITITPSSAITFSAGA